MEAFSSVLASPLGGTCPALVTSPAGTRTVRQSVTPHSHVVAYNKQHSVHHLSLPPSPRYHSTATVIRHSTHNLKNSWTFQMCRRPSSGTCDPLFIGCTFVYMCMYVLIACSPISGSAERPDESPGQVVRH